MYRKSLFTSATLAFVCSGAYAGQISVDSINGGVNLSAGDLSSVVFGNSSPTFTATELYNVNQQILSNGEAGLSLDGYVTVLAADTSEGLTLMVLSDEQTISGSGGDPDTSLEMYGSTTSSSARFVRDPHGDLSHLEGSQLQTVLGFLTWDSSTEGTGFAWASLVAGDYGALDFVGHEEGGESDPGPQEYFPSFPGLTNSNTFQFLNWNEDDGEWQVVSVENFSQTHEFAFAFNVVPIPSAAGLGLAGLFGFVLVTRRRRV